jgi:hypothetical protein
MTAVSKKVEKGREFAGLVKRIEMSNVAFKKADRATRILMVSRDVLQLLSLGRLNPERGRYFSVDVSRREVADVARKAGAGLQEVLRLPELPACTVCAIGSAMLATTLRLNKVRCKSMDVDVEFGGATLSTTFVSPEERRYNESAYPMSGTTMRVFPEALLRRMEEAFERGYYGYCNCGSVRLRLKAIYENLVKNKGKKFTDATNGEEVWPERSLRATW